MTATPKRGYLPLEEITKKYGLPYGQDWETWFHDESHESSPLIAALTAELQERGSFDEPVILCEESSDTDEETGEVEVYPAQVGNGMHRLATHYRTGVGPVFVQYEFNHPEPEAVNSLLKAKFRYTLPASTWDELYEEIKRYTGAMMDLWDYLSFRVENTPRTIWLEREGATGSKEGDFFEEEYLMVGADPRLDSLSVLAEALREHTSMLPMELVDLHWEYMDEEYEDIEKPVGFVELP